VRSNNSDRKISHEKRVSFNSHKNEDDSDHAKNDEKRENCVDLEDKVEGARAPSKASKAANDEHEQLSGECVGTRHICRGFAASGAAGSARSAVMRLRPTLAGAERTPPNCPEPGSAETPVQISNAAEEEPFRLRTADREKASAQQPQWRRALRRFGSAVAGSPVPSEGESVGFQSDIVPVVPPVPRQRFQST
jgi:hypothetical protein